MPGLIPVQVDCVDIAGLHRLYIEFVTLPEVHHFVTHLGDVGGLTGGGVGEPLRGAECLRELVNLLLLVEHLSLL